MRVYFVECWFDGALVKQVPCYEDRDLAYARAEALMIEGYDYTSVESLEVEDLEEAKWYELQTVII